MRLNRKISLQRFLIYRCGVDDLKMSDYGIKKEEAMTLAKNARATMMRLFVRDPQETTDEEIAGIYERAYR